MYICVTHVDSITKQPIDVAPLANGPAFPEVDGLVINWWNETEWPTDKPLFYGTCDDAANTDVAGVVEVLSEEDYLNKRTSQVELKSWQMRGERNQRIYAAQQSIDKALRLQRMGLPHDDIAALDIYVQALADVPEQEGFPFEIQWPTLG